MSAATLAGHRITSARVTIPAWGRWYAEVQLDGEHALTGRVSLVVADLTLSGTVLSGGPGLGRSSYRIVAGAGGWGRELAAKSYVNDATVKISTVLFDAAREAGETVAPIAATERTGPAYVREAGPACLALNVLAPRAWYVDEAGTTRLGARAAGALEGKATRITPLDAARGKVVLAAESIATILPGVVVDGLTAVDVLHEITAEGGLRSTVWGAQTPSTLDALAAVVRQLDPDRAFRGVTEYRVDTVTGSRLNLQAVRASSGMPDLKLVPVRPGVAGCEADVALASRVLVGFVDADPSRPYVAAFEDADGEGFLPTTLTLLEGTKGVARKDDEITITAAQILAAAMVAGVNPVTVTSSLKGTVTTASSKVRCG